MDETTKKTRLNGEKNSFTQGEVSSLFESPRSACTHGNSGSSFDDPNQQAETGVIDQLQLFSALLEAIPNPVFYTGTDGRYLGCNQAFARLVGLDVESISGRLISEVWPGRETSNYVERNMELLRSGGVQHYEDTVIDATGKMRDVIIQKALFEQSDGSLGGIVGVMIDITDHKRAEEDRLALQHQMLQTQRLESLGVLAGGVAHDFNNLLMVILGNIDLALKDIPSRSPVRELIENVKAASLQASELTSQMLAYAGKGRRKTQNVQLNDLIREMAQLLQVTISRMADVHYELADDLPHVEGDPAQLRQVVMNLITNASEALGNHRGTIHVRTDSIFANEKTLARTYLNDNLPAGRYVRFEVSDSGHGIDDDHLSKIFEPFFTTKFTGRGLGLAAVMGITRSHRGAIDVSSAPDDGATFTIYLPAKAQTMPADPKSKSSPAASATWQGGGTVLLVDDEPAIRDVGTTMLRRMGIKTILAENGLEALDIFRRQGGDIDLILLDVSMPLMDGREACSRLRAIRPDVPILLCTGYDEKEMTLDPILDEGLPVGFLQKPFDMHILSQKLREMLA